MQLACTLIFNNTNCNFKARKMVRNTKRLLNIITAILRRKMRGEDSSDSTDDSDGFVEFMRIYGLTEDEQSSLRKKHRFSSRFEQRPKFDEVKRYYTAKEFINAFRMDRDSFNKLSDMFYGRLKKNEEMARRSSAGPICPRVRLGITIRLLAGGSIFDLILMYKVEPSTIYVNFREVISAVNELLEFPSIPDDEEGLRQLANGFKFSRSIPNPFHGCIAAIDVIGIKIAKPKQDEYPRDFMCPKQFYCVPVQGVVDSKYRFLCFSSLSPGSSHDSYTFSLSNLRRYLEEKRLSFKYYIVGDEAYMVSAYLLTPFPGTESQHDEYKDAFNFFISSFRIHVEQAFGILVARWGMLRLGLRMSLNFAHNVVQAMLLLHNWIIDNCSEFTDRDNYTQQEAHNGWRTWLDIVEEAENEMTDLNENDKFNSSAKRDAMVEFLRGEELVRPDYNLEMNDDRRNFMTAQEFVLD